MLVVMVMTKMIAAKVITNMGEMVTIVVMAVMIIMLC